MTHVTFMGGGRKRGRERERGREVGREEGRGRGGEAILLSEDKDLRVYISALADLM